MQSSFTLFRVRGIPIGANWSWLAIAAYFVFSLDSQFRATDPGFPGSTYVVMAVVTVVLFFASLILHELGHAFRALKEGMQIEGITLWLFGGVAKFKGMFPTAGAEFRIAIAGPLVTAVISAVLYAATWILHQLGVHGAVTAVTTYLATINLTLLVFNMIPALPLDGGRVYRSYLWQRRKDFTEATVQAARTSRGLSGAMIALGVILTLRGGFGLLFILIGFFLFQAAKGELAYANFRRALGGLRVAEIMTPDPETVDIQSSVATFLENVVHLRGHSVYPVTQFGRFVGIVSAHRAAEVPVMDRLVRRIRDVMIPRTEVQTTTPEADVAEVVPLLQDEPGRLIVLDGERIVGIVSPSDISRAIELGQITRSGSPPPPTGRRSGFPFVPVLVVLALLGAASWFIYPSFVVLAPGRAYDVSKDITLSGVKSGNVNGGFILTSVSLSQPNVLQFVIALAKGREIHAISDLLPKGVDQKKYFADQEAQFDQSRQFAAAAAARAAGLPVSFSGKGAQIAQLQPGFPAAKVLKVDDVIVAVNGEPVHITADVPKAISKRPVGTRFDLTVERAKHQIHVSVATAKGPGKAPIFGVLISTRSLDVRLPFKIRFKHQDIGGPSAGVTYALAIYDMLTPKDLAHGRRISSTGTIDTEGNVGPIGGLADKAIAAKGAGATWFVVPKSEVDEAKGVGLRIVGVTTLKEAIDALGS